jgi:hypothetical protein
MPGVLVESATSRARVFYWLRLSAAVLCVCLVGVLLVIALKWPFTLRSTRESLERISESRVEIAHFRTLIFPHPGYVAQEVNFRRTEAPGGKPIAAIVKMTCRTSWLALLTFTHRIDRMDLEGVKVYIPAQVPAPIRKDSDQKIQTTVTELIANGTVLEIASRHGGNQSLRFDFPRLILNEVARQKPIHVRAEVHLPTPPSNLKVYGTVGPFRKGQIGETKLSGDFHLTDADLSTYQVIEGDLSSEGRFEGALAHVRLAGRARIPNFEVTSSRHPLGLTVEYQTTVNGTNGDVALQSAQAHFMNTTLLAQGAIAGVPAKTVSIVFHSNRAYIQDLLRLFVTSDRVPMTGAMNLSARVMLPLTNGPFLQRVHLDGDFDIGNGEFTNPNTQRSVNELSRRASGRKDEWAGGQPVSEELAGVVNLQHGIANVTSGSFRVPGAFARGSGTYDLYTKEIDLRGKLSMSTSLSKAAGGFKSVLLTPLDPLFRKDGAGALVPVKVTGTYEHPRFKLSFIP